MVDVDEQGTEAAAVTGVVMTRALLAFPVSFHADRPFFFSVRHVPSGADLFVGRVADVRRWGPEAEARRAAGARGVRGGAAGARPPAGGGGGGPGSAGGATI